MDRDDTSLEQPVADALRALKQAGVVPPADPAHEAALLAAFDAALSERRRSNGAGPATVEPRVRRDYWYLGAFAAAAALFIAAALPAVRDSRHGATSFQASRPRPVQSSSRDVELASPGEFVIVPGAAGLPPMESGTLVRMDVPVSVLPSLGVTPPPGQARVVTADFVVAQDGLPRAVRLVSP